MNSKTIKKDGYNIHVIKTDKFKPVELHVLFCNESKEDNYLVEAFGRLLYSGTKYYKTKRDRLIKEEELYGEISDIDYSVYGRMLTVDVNSYFINPKLVQDDYTEEAIKFQFDILDNPIFDEDYLGKIKDDMKNAFKLSIEHPRAYATRQAKNLYFNDPRDNYNFLVEDELVDTITIDRIKAKYDEIINSSNIEVILIGDVDDTYIEYIDKYLKHKSVNKELTKMIKNVPTNKLKEKKETKEDIHQAQVINYYNVDLKDETERMAFIIYGSILDSPLGGRLFKIIREENHLCYDINIDYVHTKGAASIKAGVDKDNVELTQKLIDEILSKDDFSDEELMQAKQYVISAMERGQDSIGGVFKEYHDNIVLGLMPLKERIETIKKVTKEDVIKIKDKMTLDTRYVLEGK